MKVLFVESTLSGHRKVYHKTLINCFGGDSSILITPEYENDVRCEQVVDKTVDLRPRGFASYIKWIRYIKKIAQEYKVTVVHFLDGDILYRFCGYYLRELKNYNTIVTFHHVAEDIIHTLSVGMITKNVTYAVVHTENLRVRFQNVCNLTLIDYPYFPLIEAMPSKSVSRAFYNIEMDKIVLLALGGTRYEKGVDVLLSSAKGIKDNRVVLLVAGKEEFFKQQDLEKIDTGKVDVIYFMKTLSDLEWCMAISASDFVVLPYRKIFEGASGPLTEAIWFDKPVIGKKDGSIGYAIQKYNLGWTFESENIEDLTGVINCAVKKGFKKSANYCKYKKKISVSSFEKKYKNIYQAY